MSLVEAPPPVQPEEPKEITLLLSPGGSAYPSLSNRSYRLLRVVKFTEWRLAPRQWIVYALVICEGMETALVRVKDHEGVYEDREDARAVCAGLRLHLRRLNQMLPGTGSGW